MARIFSINPIVEISLDDAFIIRADEEFVCIEIKNFHWHHHSLSCNDCTEFFKTFGQETYRWLLELNGEFFNLIPDNFGKIDDYFANSCQFIISPDFSGTKVKIKVNEASRLVMEAKIIFAESEQRYEHCQELKNNISFLQS